MDVEGYLVRTVSTPGANVADDVEIGKHPAWKEKDGVHLRRLHRRAEARTYHSARAHLAPLPYAAASRRSPNVRKGAAKQ